MNSQRPESRNRRKAFWGPRPVPRRPGFRPGRRGLGFEALEDRRLLAASQFQLVWTGDYPAGDDVNQATIGDFNADGKPDVAVSNFNDSGEKADEVLFGNRPGKGTAKRADRGRVAEDLAWLYEFDPRALKRESSRVREVFSHEDLLA